MPAAGKASFVCDRDGHELVGDLRLEADCPRCGPGVPFNWSKPQDVLNHMAGHLLYDPGVERTAEPCGFCLQPAPLCYFYLRKSKGAEGGMQVDFKRSHGCTKCTYFRYAPASRSTTKSPSSNVPLACPLCDPKAPAVWKYNFDAHFARWHPRADASQYVALSNVPASERSAVRHLWNKRSVKRKKVKKTTLSALAISTSHLIQLAETSVCATDCCKR
ncbi:hypothetical protein AURDEDRAFT_62161 [Auricularia subglabra TFB-10046 SS5]|nr:hypothetical protein AURDEDRAFT_62161 [Auricularia subglabra TFB-10046 SS5]